MSNIPIFVEEYLMFLRKSRSDNQGETLEETLARHERDLQELAVKITGKEVPERNIYREIVSGGEELENRPDFLRLLKRLEDGSVKGVLVVEPQRLSRSGMYGAGDVINAFRYTDTLIVTPSKTYNLNDQYDKKFIEMELMQGAEYLEYTKQILARGKNRSIKEGKYIGAEPPYGYNKEKIKNDKGYKLTINKDEAEVVKMIFETYLELNSKNGVANYLNKLAIKPRNKPYWKPEYINTILTDPTYYGLLIWKKRITTKVLKDGRIETKLKKNDKPILVKGMHEPIISKELYIVVQERMLGNRPTKINHSQELKNPLASLLYCGVCDYAMVRQPVNVTPSKQTVRRVHELDKASLSKFLYDKKKASGLTTAKIALMLDVTEGKVASWLSKDPNRAYYSKTFAEYWFKIKEVLNIEETHFDEAITKYDTPPKKINYVCSNPRCKNVSSYCSIVESRVLEALQAKLSDYKYFVDNYEEVIIKEAKSNAMTVSRIEKDIEKLNKRLKNARTFYELEDYTREEYLETKKEIENELSILNANLEEIKKDENEDKIIQYKKSIPILTECLKKYRQLSIADKNELLKNIIKKIEYTKTEAGTRHRPDLKDKFILEVDLKI